MAFPDEESGAAGLVYQHISHTLNWCRQGLARGKDCKLFYYFNTCCIVENIFPTHRGSRVTADMSGGKQKLLCAWKLVSTSHLRNGELCWEMANRINAGGKHETGVDIPGEKSEKHNHHTSQKGNGFPLHKWGAEWEAVCIYLWISAGLFPFCSLMVTARRRALCKMT